MSAELPLWGAMLWVVGAALLLALVSRGAYLRTRQRLPAGGLVGHILNSNASLGGIGLCLLGLQVSARAPWLKLLAATGLALCASCLLLRWLGQPHHEGQVPSGPPDPPGDEPAPGPSHHPRSRHRRTIPLWAEGLALLALAPGLWFPTIEPALTVLSVLGLLALWLVLALGERRLWPVSSYDVALACLLGAAAVGTWRSTAPLLSLPKVTSLLLGLGLYRAILARVRDPRALRGAVCAFIGLGLLFCLVGLTNGLRPSKVSALGATLARLPRWLQDLPEAQGGRASTNQLGGVILFVLPLALGAALAHPKHGGRRATLRPFERLFLGLAVALLACSLLLSQSRGAWAGAIVGLLLFVALRWPRGRWIILLLCALAAIAWLFWGKRYLGPLLLEVFAAKAAPRTPWGTVNLTGRLRIWDQALAYTRASPIVGHGLGTYRMWDARSLTGPSAFDSGTPHAHNVFLQVAYDTGLVGLTAYLALVMIATATAWRVYRLADGAARGLAIGSLAALAAYHVYGLVDVVALGAKPGILWWALLAVIGVLPRMAPPATRRHGPR